MAACWGHLPSKAVQKSLKLGVKGVIDSISDRLHLRRNVEHQSLEKKSAVEIVFRRLSTAA